MPYIYMVRPKSLMGLAGLQTTLLMICTITTQQVWRMHQSANKCQVRKKSSVYEWLQVGRLETL